MTVDQRKWADLLSAEFNLRLAGFAGGDVDQLRASLPAIVAEVELVAVTMGVPKDFFDRCARNLYGSLANNRKPLFPGL